MSLDLKEIVGNIFHLSEDEQTEQENNAIQQRTSRYLRSNQNDDEGYNPFETQYQLLLNSPKVSDSVKRYIQLTTGLSPTDGTQNTSQIASTSPVGNFTYTSQGKSYTPTYTSQGTGYSGTSGTVSSGSNSGSLASLDVVTELPKLSESQIADIISKHFSKSTVISPSDAAGIYQAQQESGMSALAILGIGALESGYGTSNIAKQKNNLWGWAAYNSNPMGSAKTFSPISEGALQFANSYLGTYYDKYGAKSIYSAGTGNNPSGMGYAYNNDGSVNPNWATQVGQIMNNFYTTATGSPYVAPSASNNGQDTANQTSQEKFPIGYSQADDIAKRGWAYSEEKYPDISAEEQKARGIYPSGQYPVGERISDIYNPVRVFGDTDNKGECVWYVRHRAKEKLGVDMTYRGHGNQQYTNAPAHAQVAATIDNLRGDMIASFKHGSKSWKGQTYGHVVYIEDVVGDTVYFTDGGRNSDAYKGYFGGTVRTATREQFLQGVDSTGKQFSTEIVGLVDVTKLPGYIGAQKSSATETKDTSKSSTSNSSKSKSSTVSKAQTQGEKDARSSSKEMEEWKKSKNKEATKSAATGSATTIANAMKDWNPKNTKR